MCMAKKGKDNKQKRRIARRMTFVSNGEKCMMHKFDWCEGGMQLSDIDTNNIGENDLTPRIKYIMVILDNWYITHVKEGLQNIGQSTEQEFCTTRLDWYQELTQSVWNVCIKFWYAKIALGNVCSRKTI